MTYIVSESSLNLINLKYTPVLTNSACSTSPVLLHKESGLVFFQGINLNSVCESGQVMYLDGLRLVAEALDNTGQEDSTGYCTSTSSDSGDHSLFTNLR